jgi:hypothetical protein
MGLEACRSVSVKFMWQSPAMVTLDRRRMKMGNKVNLETPKNSHAFFWEG